MKSLRMKADRSLYFKECTKPEILEPDQVLVRMQYASICGYDIMVYKGKAGRTPNGEIGHEGSGIVEAIGSAVTTLKPGDRVTMETGKSCGRCEACRSNHDEYCINRVGYARFMTEYILFDQAMVYKVPDTISLKEACLTEPLMMAMYAVQKANLSCGKNVILLGCGAMGQIILKLLNQMPLGKIVVIEPDAAKREAALRFGADIALNPNAGNMMSEALMLSGGQGYDAVLEVSGNRESAKAAFNLVARGGSVVYFALYGMDFSLDLNLFALYWKDATISAVSVPSGMFSSALRMMPRLKLEEVITALYPFDQAIEAFAAKAAGGHAKVMLEFPKPEGDFE